MDLFERVVSAQGRLLRVEQYVDPVKRNTSLVPGLLLTFDVGRILVWGSAKPPALRLEHISNPDEIPTRLERLDEKEPWWRILGSPLAAVQPINDEPGYRLQFRKDESNPRTISLTLQGDHIRISLDKKPIVTDEVNLHR